MDRLPFIASNRLTELNNVIAKTRILKVMFVYKILYKIFRYMVEGNLF